MPRHRFFSRAASWDPSDIKLPEGPRSRRRRILNRITRFASSPTLLRNGSASSTSIAAVQQSQKHAVSCISLTGGGGEPCVTYGVHAGTESSLQLFVDCEEGVPPAARAARAGWETLPDEVKMSILRWCKPKELVSVSSVSVSLRVESGTVGRWC